MLNRFITNAKERFFDGAAKPILPPAPAIKESAYGL